ncbi:MAG TPA: hypothetical protein VJN18_11160 [Polyangiaceae bacterium]|nr:hypothetical protein [Polyangiaceae bacterium]
MSAQTFVLLVLCVALGYVLGTLLAGGTNTVQRLLIVLLGVAVVVLWLQVGPRRWSAVQPDQATDKCPLSVARMTRRVPAAWRGPPPLPSLNSPTFRLHLSLWT